MCGESRTHGVKWGKTTRNRKADDVRYLSFSTGITQNISDLLKSQAAETIFSNSSLVVMLNQAPGDRAALARLLNISENQQQYINNARKGSGLIWTGQAIIPFYDEFPQNTKLYQMMSTNATESLAEAATSERMSRQSKPMTEKEKADEEYEAYQKQQKEFYQDQKVADDDSQSLKGADESRRPVQNAFDDYPDDGFGPDPFSAPKSQDDDEYDMNDLFDDDDDDDFPDEFDTMFGGGSNSMFSANAKKPSMPAKPAVSQGASPKSTQQVNKPAQSTKATDKNQEALNSFFNI